MTGKVIQGFFPGGQPKLAAVQPRIAAPPPIQAKIAAPAPATAFAGRSPGPPIPAFAPGSPAPASGPRTGAVQRHGAGNAFAVDSGALGLASGGGKPLPDAVRGQMEAALGADFSAVRVHVGPQAERIGAIAFTVGSDIYFAPGRYQPDTVHGQQLLGHELVHVVQQRVGRVRNPLGSGLAVVQDHALEAEADRLGQRAAMHRVAAQAKMPTGAAQPSAPVRISPSKAVPAQSVNRTVAPPVYRPQAKPNAVQQRTGSSAPAGISRMGPAIYHPQPATLQRKEAIQPQSPDGQSLQTPVAPPVYYSQPSKVLQRMTPVGQQRPAGPQANGLASPPPVFRSITTPKALQTSATLNSGTLLGSVLRMPAGTKPNGGRSVLQQKNSAELRGTSLSAPAISSRGRTQVIQRLVLAMGQDQQHAATVLAQSREGWFSSAEEYGLFDGFPDFTKNTDKNITLWGHAGQTGYGGKSVAELVRELKEKNLARSAHILLELIGCGPNMTDDQSTETYAQLLQKTLNEDTDFSRRITVKAYPMPEPGGSSTNLRLDQINKFIYIYGGTRALGEAETRIKLLLKIHTDQEVAYQKIIEYLKTVDGLQYKTGAYKDIRSHLETTHVVTTHKTVFGKSQELLVPKVY